MEINMNEWADQIINSSEVKSFPVMTFPGLELAGKNVREIVTDAGAQYEVMKVLGEKYPSIAVVSAMDLTIEPEAFGCPIVLLDDDAPRVKNGIVSDLESAKSLKVPSADSGRIPVFVEAAEMAAKNITDRPTFGGILGSFSLAALLFGMKKIMKSLVKDPESVHIVLEKSTQLLIEYARAYKKAGANGIFIAEPTAGLLSAEQCDEFSSKYVKKIVDELQDEEFLMILHNCGYTTHLVPSMLSTGAKGQHFGNAVDMAKITAMIPKDILVGGNLDPTEVFKEGSIEYVKEKTWNLLKKTKNFKNFFISSGCDLPPGVPTANIDAFFETIDKFNKEKKK